jgi:hypothetical protein
VDERIYTRVVNAKIILGTLSAGVASLITLMILAFAFHLVSEYLSANCAQYSDFDPRNHTGINSSSS